MTRWNVLFAGVMMVAATGLATSGLAANPAQAALSAARPASQPGSKYVHRAEFRALKSGNNQSSGTVIWEKGPFDSAKWERVPEISAAALQSTFEHARDEKAFTDEESRARRASWLYPDDGCFVRAAVVADVIAKNAAVKTAKIFAFGSLSVDTVNSPDHYVTWWYHVAAIAKITDPAASGDKTVYVYDPAIDPKAPMEVHAWLSAMHDPGVQIAICSGDAYDPNSDCANGQSDTLLRARGDAGSYLTSEWYRVQELGRDPRRELGDFPPWLTP